MQSCGQSPVIADYLILQNVAGNCLACEMDKFRSHLVSLHHPGSHVVSSHTHLVSLQNPGRSVLAQSRVVRPPCLHHRACPAPAPTAVSGATAAAAPVQSGAGAAAMKGRRHQVSHVQPLWRCWPARPGTVQPLCQWRPPCPGPPLSWPAPGREQEAGRSAGLM